MREKLLSIGDDFWIENEDGERAYKVDGKAVRVRQTFVLEDASGDEVARIQERKLSIRDKVAISVAVDSLTLARRNAGGPAHGTRVRHRRTRRPGRRARHEADGGPASLPRLGVWSWTFVGLVAATIIVVAALAAVSEIVLPLTFAAVLAVIFKPLVGVLERHRLKPTVAASVVVLGLLALMTGVVVATVRGVTDQADQINASVDAALHNAVTTLGIDQATLDSARAATEAAAPMIKNGFLTELVDGISTLAGLASGLLLGALIMYYLLKDGARLRRAVVARFDPGSGTRSTASSATLAESSATTRGPARSCPRSCPWSSALPASYLASRSCSPSWW